MIKKFTSGNPIDTQAVVEKFNALPIAEFPLGGKFENGNFVFEFDMADSDIVYGLGEAPRGINKRGWVYNSFCSDDPFHTETKSSLYAAHNFLMLSGSKTFGIFIDFPSKIRWDIGYTTTNKTVITIDGTDFDIYPDSFFQVNQFLTERLYNKAVKFANLTGKETVFDLYCGAGTLTAALSKHAGRVFGIEVVPSAVKLAR